MKRSIAISCCIGLIAGAYVGSAQPAPFVRVGNDRYDEVLDRGTTVAEVHGVETMLDCSRVPVVSRAGNDFLVAVARYDAGGNGTACAYDRLQVELGTLVRGDYRVTIRIVTADGSVAAVTESDFHVRPYESSCNRYPDAGSVLNVFHESLDGAGIADLLASHPSLAAELGDPVVSLTLYNNAGAQLVYPTPVDPVPWRDRAEATGLFWFVGMVRGRSCWAGITPADGQSEVVEYRRADLDAYFYATESPEIAALDAGTVWTRTGKTFHAITNPCGERPDLFLAYRFVGRPGVGPASHVFTIDQEECYAVNRSGGWTFEGVAFYAERALRSGGCAYAGHVPLYRVWRPFGESRHRFTTDRAVVAQHVAAGWIDEGAVMCVLN